MSNKYDPGIQRDKTTKLEPSQGSIRKRGATGCIPGTEQLLEYWRPLATLGIGRAENLRSIHGKLLRSAGSTKVELFKIFSKAATVLRKFSEVPTNTAVCRR